VLRKYAYASAAVGVRPWKQTKGMGVVNGEAMLIGKSVLTSACVICNVLIDLQFLCARNWLLLMLPLSSNIFTCITFVPNLLVV
jgi:hypothetical protein